MTPGRELFVYYRVRADRAEAMRNGVLALQRSLRRDVPGIEARLLVRHGGDGDTATWMETYALPMLGVDEPMQSRIAAAAKSLAPFIDGTRHVETFVAVSCNDDVDVDHTD